MSQVHDVVVVGAGPGGAAAAAWLARAGLDVLLLDKADFPRDKTCGDAVSPSAVSLLDDLGLADALQLSGQRIGRVAITAPGGTTIRVPIPAHPRYPDFAYVIPRYVLDERIRAAAVAAGARFEGGVRVTGAQHTEGGDVEVHALQRGDARRYCARVLVLAVGASTPLLAALGFASRSVQFSYAARAYFEGFEGLANDLHIRFDGVPLPGYGWIFPTSAQSANVGAGFYRRTRNTPPTAAATLTQFLAHPAIQQQLGGARLVGPVKGYPLRTDFHRSRTFGPRTLIVGESAGLVNPFTGEGIDYAMESAQFAFHVLRDGFERGVFSTDELRAYDRLMRQRFQWLFVVTHLMRRFYMNPLLLDPLIRACTRWPELGRLLVDILLSYRSPLNAFRPGVILKVARSLAVNRPEFGHRSEFPHG